MPAAAVQTQKSVHPLRVRDFRLLWIGESVSLLGDQFYLIALPWLVLQLTGSALALGTVLALASIPRALFMIVGGALVDRFSPRAVMFASNLTRFVLVGLLALLVLTNNIQLWMLYVLALAFGTADAFYFPAQSSMVPALLKDDQLEMGNTLTQGMAMLSMFVGPVIAGLVIAVLGGSVADATPSTEGIGIAFALDSLSFLASLVVLWLIRTRKAGAASAQSNVIASIKEGMSYVWKSTTLRMIFVLLIAINLFVTGPFEIGIPVLAKLNLAEGATAFGMILLTISTSTPVVAFISLAMGATMGYVNINFMTWLQRRIPQDLMGRVMSLIMFASVGVAPVSSTVAGIILNINVDALFIGAGALMAVVTVISTTTRAVRHMGLEVAEIERKESIAEVLRATDELPALRSTGSMPAVRL